MNDFCNESEILSVAAAMVQRGFVKKGLSLVQLDDCWAATNRTVDGRIQEDKSRFPSGMKDMISKLHGMGLIISLYTDIGEKTCRGGRLGSWPYYESDAQTFNDWGVDMIKCDWCNHPHQFTPQQLYTNLSQALATYAPNTMFSICEWGLFTPWTWAPKIANAWRVGPDHIPVWWSPATGQDPGQGQGTSNIIQHMAGLSKYTSPGHWNDPDFIELEGYESDTEAQTQVSFWALWAAPYVVATDPRKSSKRMDMFLNDEVIAINQDPLVKAGDLRLNNSDASQVWTRPLAQAQSWAVIVYNSHVWPWQSSVHNVAIPFNAQVLPGLLSNSSTAISVRDVFAAKDLGTFKGSYTSPPLKPRASRLYVLTVTAAKK